MAQKTFEEVVMEAVRSGKHIIIDVVSSAVLLGLTAKSGTEYELGIMSLKSGLTFTASTFSDENGLEDIARVKVGDQICIEIEGLHGRKSSRQLQSGEDVYDAAAGSFEILAIQEQTREGMEVLTGRPRREARKVVKKQSDLERALEERQRQQGEGEEGKGAEPGAVP